MRARSVLMISVVLFVACAARGAGTPDEVPFQLAHGFGIVVRGGIGPLSALNFLVDTGTVPSVLSDRIASRIGASGVPDTFSLLSKNIQTQYVTVDELRFGPIRAVRRTMAVVDLRRFDRLLGVRVDAVVGLDILGRRSLSIDYRCRRITFGSSGLAQHVLPVEIHTVSGAPYWVVPIRLGDRNLRVLLDTGSDNVAVFAGHTAGMEPVPTARSVANTTGEARPLRPLPLVVGDVSRNRQPAVVLDEPPVTALQAIDGLLSPTAMGMRRIEFDWDHQCLRWDAE